MNRMASQQQAGGPPLIPGTSYRHGTCINVCGHDFVLTDDADMLQEYTSPTAHLTMVNSSHKGSVFMAPDNDMAKGLVMFSLCPNAKSVVPHYWMLSTLFEEQQQKLREQAPGKQSFSHYDNRANQNNAAMGQGHPYDRKPQAYGAQAQYGGQPEPYPPQQPQFQQQQQQGGGGAPRFSPSRDQYGQPQQQQQQQQRGYNY